MIIDPSYTVDFGVIYSGLSTVGYSLSGQARTTIGVTELVPGWGVYGVSLNSVPGPGYILWDTGTDPIRHSVEDINPFFNPSLFKVVNFGPFRSGLATVGITVNGNRQIVPELFPETGIYGGTVIPPSGFVGPVFWDTGEDSDQIRYASDSINTQYMLLGYFKTASYIMRKLGRDLGVLEIK